VERDTASFQPNIDLPIAGAATPSLTSIAALSANATVAAERLSNIGTLWTLGYGLHWTPLPGYHCSHRSATRDRPRRSNSLARR
jgi:hypothetical protein